VYGDTVYRLVEESGDSEGLVAYNRLLAYEVASGRLRWSRPLYTFVPIAVAPAGVVAVTTTAPTFAASQSSPVAVAGMERFWLTLLDPSTGDARWTYPLRPSLAAYPLSPIVAGGVVYYVDPNGTVYAVDLLSGSERWVATATQVRRPLAPDACAQPNPPCNVDKLGNTGLALAGNTLYVTNGEALLSALNATDGTLRWAVGLAARYGLEGRLIAYPTATERGVLIGLARVPDIVPGPIEHIQLVLLDQATGGEIWRQQPPHAESVVATVDAERVYVSATSQRGCCAIAALDLDTGQEVWRLDAAWIELVGLSADGTLHIRRDAFFVTGEFSFDIAALDPATGKELSSQRIDALPVFPFAADGTLFAISSQGALLAYTVIPTPGIASPMPD
jgi:outer membrane protein assembly factor BamB